MPVKILLADKSITIQKVVEMLFSGKEYEVTCVSDGDSAFSEAARIVPDVVLADVDLPRMDGYSFAGRLRETPALAKVPVILMLSRDDVYDAMKGKLAGLADNIAKPFESQELIGKVKKALLSAPPPAPAARPAVETAPAPKPAAATPAPPKPAPPQPKPVAAPPPPPKPAAEPPSKPTVPPAAARPVVEAAPAPKVTAAVPKDIFDIIDEAPADSVMPPPPVKQSAPSVAKTAAPEEELFEVEPEYEVEPEIEPGPEKSAAAAPVSAAELKDAWAGLMTEEKAAAGPAPAATIRPAETPLPTADAFDTANLFGREPIPPAAPAAPAPGPAPAVEAPLPVAEAIPTFDFSEPLPAEAGEALPLGQRAMDEMREGLGLGEAAERASEMHPDIVSFESLDVASRALHEDYTFTAPEPELTTPPAPSAFVPPAVPAAELRAAAPPSTPEASDAMLRSVARESIEKVIRQVLEQVAWEVLPDLAERLIREEIERLKAETQ